MVNDHDIEKMLRAIFEREAATNPLIAMMRSKFESDLPDLIRKVAERDMRQTELVIEVAKSWGGFHRPFAQVVVVANHEGEFKPDLDTIASVAAVIMQMVEAVQPMPADGRLEFACNGRLSRFGGDEITEDMAIDMAQQLVGCIE